ncbi:MAG: PTS sugar transporter subunit IIA [Desulfohalobiaceae bacterium]
MVGVLLVTHLDFGHKLLQTAEQILGEQQGCLAISVNVQRKMEDILQEIQAGIQEVDRGQGVLVLTDMFGGSPSNLSLSLLGSGRLEVITGANLPMLLKILGCRELDLQEVALQAKSAGQQGIVVAGEVLKQKVTDG